MDREKPCNACARAKAEYDARLRDTDEKRFVARIRAKAQWQAHQVLAHRYPEEYREAYLIKLALAMEAAAETLQEMQE